MKITWYRSLIIGSAMCGALMSTNVLADNMKPGAYIGGGYGMVDVNDSEFEDDDVSKKLYVGGKLGPYFGIEGGLHDFGEASNQFASWELDGKTLAVVGFLPFNESFSLFAKAGNLWWDADVSLLGLKGDFDGSEMFGGVGVQLNFTENFAIRAEYERYKVELEADEIGMDVDSDSKVNIASLGAQFNF